jgi:hypothetical protein
MAKLNVGTPRTRAVNPPSPLRSDRRGGNRETLWRSAITLERQISDPPPASADAYNFRMDAQPGFVRRVLTRRRP